MTASPTTYALLFDVAPPPTPLERLLHLAPRRRPPLPSCPRPRSRRGPAGERIRTRRPVLISPRYRAGAGDRHAERYPRGARAAPLRPPGHTDSGGTLLRRRAPQYPARAQQPDHTGPRGRDEPSHRSRPGTARPSPPLNFPCPETPLSDTPLSLEPAEQLLSLAADFTRFNDVDLRHAVNENRPAAILGTQTAGAQALAHSAAPQPTAPGASAAL